jgi:hypothetical protein
LRPAILISLLLLMGCHNHLWMAPPRFQRAPELTCIVVVQSDRISAEIAEAALSACRDARERRRFTK